MHTVIWVKDAPKYDESSDSVVCDFIDQYISCCILVRSNIKAYAAGRY